MIGAIEQLVHKPNMIFVRHGNTAMNEDGDKIRGWKDVPLSDKGQKEAVDIGKKLKDKDFDGIIASDLKRTRETAESISKETGKPILGFTMALRPWNAGIFTGQESNKILSKLNQYIEHPEEKIPEGESFDDFKKRYLDAINDIKKYFPGKKILVVAHHRNNVLLDAWQAAGQKKDYSIDTSEMEKKGISPGEFKEYHV